MFNSIKSWFQRRFAAKAPVAQPNGTVYYHKGSPRYAIDYNDVIGEGGCGQVYRAEALPSRKPLVAKLIHPNQINNPVEIAALKEEARRAHYYFSDVKHTTLQKAPDSPQTPALFMEFIPGVELFTLIKEESVEFEEGVSIAWQLALQLNQMHHNTPETGDAIIHNDLKLENAMVNRRNHYGKKVTDARIIDLGLSQVNEVAISDKPLDFNNPNRQFKADPNGTPHYISPERALGYTSTKADVFSLGCLYIILFGGRDSCEKRGAYYLNQRYNEFLNCSPSVQNLFSDVNVPLLAGLDIKPILTRFLQRMVILKDYEARPDTNEVLRFFTSLQQLCAQSKMPNPDTDLQMRNIAQMRLIADGFWTALPAELDLDDAKAFCNALYSNAPLTKEKFKELLDAEMPPELNRIVSHCKVFKLNPKPIMKLLRATPAAGAIRTLLSENPHLIKSINPFARHGLIREELMAILPNKAEGATALFSALRRLQHPDLFDKLQLVLHAGFQSPNRSGLEALIPQLTNSTLLKLYTFICVERRALITAFGAEQVEKVLGILIKPLLDKSLQSYQQKLDADLINHSEKHHRGWSLGYSLGDKKKAVDSLCSAYQTGNFNLLFSKQNKATQKALQQGRLGEVSEELLSYASELHKATTSAA